MRKRGPRSNPKDWPAPIPGRCNFRRKNHTRCKNYPVNGKKRCNRHLNKAKEGPDHPQWKGGVSRGWARKHLPVRLLERFDSVVNDPELTSVRELIAVAGTRLTELFDKIDERESKEAWESLGFVLGEIEKALDSEDYDAAAKMVAVGFQHYKSAKYERGVWSEIFQTMERSRKLVDTERRREEMLQANLTAQQAIALFNQLFQLIADEIKEADLRARLGTRILDWLQAQSPEMVLDVKQLPSAQIVEK